jgi:hypothetical protein
VKSLVPYYLAIIDQQPIFRIVAVTLPLLIDEDPHRLPPLREVLLVNRVLIESWYLRERTAECHPGRAVLRRTALTLRRHRHVLGNASAKLLSQPHLNSDRKSLIPLDDKLVEPQNDGILIAWRVFTSKEEDAGLTVS